MDIGPPQLICLPATMVEKQTVATMTKNQFSSTLKTKGAGYTYPLLNQIAVTTTEDMMQIEPTPLYFVYDRFGNDLDAACVLERVMLVSPIETDGIKHLKKSLQECLTSHNAGNKNPYVCRHGIIGGSERPGAPVGKGGLHKGISDTRRSDGC